MLDWFILVLVLLVVLAWDSSAKWAASQRSVETLAIQLDDMEERHREAQEQYRRDREEMQESIWRLACRAAGLQQRMEALTARLDMVESCYAAGDDGPYAVRRAEAEASGDDAKARTAGAVHAFMSSFERGTAEPLTSKPLARPAAQVGLREALAAAASRSDRSRQSA